MNPDNYSFGSFSIFGVNDDDAMRKTAAKYSPVILTLKSDLFNFIKENVCI